jgi:hypothetical protein
MVSENSDDVTIVIAPDRDAEAPTAKVLRQLPVQGATDTVRLPPSPREAGAAEDTEIYVVARGMVRLERLAPQIDRVLLGGGPFTDVPVPESAADCTQVAIVRRPDGWFFMDRGHDDVCTFDGVPTIQYRTTTVSRTVIGMGKSWGVFFGARGIAPNSRSQTIPVRDAVGNGPHAEISCENGEVAGTWGEAVLIGSHEKADLRPSQSEVTAFHGMLFWTPAGLAYQPLARGLEAVPLEPGSSGERRIRDRGVEMCVNFVGDYMSVARRQAQLRPTEWPQFALNPHEARHPQLLLSRRRRQFTLGRGGCDLRLPDKSISRLHLQIATDMKSFTVTDCGSSNGTFVNGGKLKAQSPRRVFAGDELVIGSCRYRVSYGQ